MKQKLHFALLLAAFFSPLALLATHNRAGEIHVQQIGPLTVRATIITWTKISGPSINADRDTLEINWGDGTVQKVARSNGGGEGELVAPDVKRNIYISEHTYAGPATYRISMTDMNRNGGIRNVNFPASDNIPFHIETIYTFQDPQFGGENTTPYLLQYPIDQACVGKPFRHNPNADDPDGDSLSYQLITPLQGVGTPVIRYEFPNNIGGNSTNNILQINPVTGDILWASPQEAGEYNIAFIVVSWREGEPIDTTIRDMQIFVSACDNNPPLVEVEKKICVIAGDTVLLSVKATDPDSGNLVMLTAVGAPLNSAYSPATFQAPGVYQEPPVFGTFRWITACEHISNQPYSVVFKATDSMDIPQLADLKTLQIKVVGPPPLGVQAEAATTEVEITWDKPYACEGAAEQYFFGFSVWRREGSNPFVPDSCTPGLAGRGYEELIFVTKQVQDGRYRFVDTQVERGRTYCYRVLAKFARLSAAGYPYNIVESLPSEEVCVQLPRDLPLITNVSVQETDPANGTMRIAWSKPSGVDLDTILNHGPYRYQLLRGNGFSGGALQELPGASFVSNTFWQANDTIYEFDQNLNTFGGPYHYQVDFYVKGNVLLGSTNDASSVFLTITPSDQTNILTWQETVPWNNYQYVIYRLNPATQQFDSIGFAGTPYYEDRGLINGVEYCYYVKSVGTYSIGGVADPLYNLSQQACGSPIDLIPPCPPVLDVTNLCDAAGNIAVQPPYNNDLSWTNPNLACGGSDDVVTYNIWFAPEEGLPLTLLTTQDGADNIHFTHALETGLAGCYAVSAIDSVGNESEKSNVVCVDNCPKYELPNVFTPNGDQANDLYTPFPGWRFIDRVDFQVFNRWGNLVFNTSNPELNWNGTDQQGKKLAEGAYFYVCKVYESRVGGITLRPDVLSGYIEIIVN
ncbi:MAG: gliding motility-associated C-terminal domain-containing protein [Saprospiraceae bacterium]|nr:gliding motility-associated C-terminal domain-containing protein [Saprospiraceae bacterium]